jgi:hypothetical protein
MRQKMGADTMTKQNIASFFIAGFSACVLAAAGATANPITFQGQNAALFPGANPADTATLMNSVPKPNSGISSAALGGISASQLVLQSIESQISSRIYADIFGNGAAPSGTELLGDGSSISWAPDPNQPGFKIITVTDANGRVTTFDVN